DRSLPCAHRALRRRDGREGGGRVRQEHRPSRCGAKRRSQLSGPVRLRRRHRHRPGADEGDPRRPGDAHGETQWFGLGTTGGVVSHTGVAGLTLGGGIGWLHRRHGLTIDQLLSVDLVTAGGEFVKASETENADLFYGVRGGGGNFGIVTEFKFRLHPVGPTVFAGPIFWRMDEAPELLRFYRDWSSELPDEMMTILGQRREPSTEFVPPELHGELAVKVTSCSSASLEEGETAVGPRKAFGSPVLDA